MYTNKLDEDLYIPNFIRIKIWRQDGVEFLMTLKEDASKCWLKAVLLKGYTWKSKLLTKTLRVTYHLNPYRDSQLVRRPSGL